MCKKGCNKMKLTGRGSGLSNIGGGTVELTDDSVILMKKNTAISGGGLIGLGIDLATSSKGAHSIPYEQIVSVHISMGGIMSKPFIQILTAGEKSIGDAQEAASSPNCLSFSKSAASDFEQLRGEIESRSRASKKQTQTVQPSNGGGVADELGKLAGLLNAGLLSQEEFDAQKTKLLG